MWKDGDGGVEKHIKSSEKNRERRGGKKGLEVFKAQCDKALAGMI